MQPRHDRIAAHVSTRRRFTFALALALTLALVLALMLPVPGRAADTPEADPASATQARSEEEAPAPGQSSEAAPGDSVAEGEEPGEDGVETVRETTAPPADEVASTDEPADADESSDTDEVQAPFTAKSRTARVSRRSSPPLTGFGGGSGLPNCKAGEVYSISAEGKMRRLDPGKKTWVEVDNGALTGGGDASFNGLAVHNDDQGNSTWYVYARSQEVTHQEPNPSFGPEDPNPFISYYTPTIQVYKNENGGGWQPVGDVYFFPEELPKKLALNWPNGAIVAPHVKPLNTVLGGTVNPKDGSFWIMQYTPMGGKWSDFSSQYEPMTKTRIRLVRVDPDTGKFQDRGFVDVPVFKGRDGVNDAPGETNGDLAFDPNGNAYVVQTVTSVGGAAAEPNSHGATKIHMIPAEDINKAGSGFTLISPPKERFPDGLGRNTGIAFDFPAGSLVVADQNGSKAFTPPQLKMVENSEATGLDNSFDLASCSFPHTLELKKDVVERLNGADQFHLKITAAQTDVLAEATTTGSATGVQQEVAGPILVSQGAKFQLSEEMAAGSVSELSAYDTSLSCVETSYSGSELGPVEVSVTTSGGVREVTIPNVPKGGGQSLHVVCTFTNSPLHDLVVKKVDKDDSSPLAGAKFQLWLDGNGDGKVNEPGDTLIGTSGPTPATGQVTFEDLKSGKYLLVETEAPEGYELLAQPQPVTVAAGTAVTEIEVENEKVQVNGSVTWSKVDKDNGKPLKDSVWELKLKGSEGNVKTVTDCVGTGPEACTDLLDKDPAEGSFKVIDLALGSWTLTETKAPFGYKLDKTPRSFELTEANAEKGIALGKITNEKQAVPPLPHTGGLGSDAFLIAGGLVLLLALALGGGTYARRYRL